MNSRVNAFDALDLGDFAAEPPPTPKPVEAEAIDAIAKASGFPSRKATAKPAPAVKAPARQDVPPVIAEPAPRQTRRYTTGRNQQINIKATSETIDQFYRVADQLNVPLGAVLELALDALEKEKATAKR